MSPGNNRFRSIESCQQMELVHLSTHCVPFCSKSFQTKQRFGFLYMKCPSRDRAHWCRWAYIVKIRPSWWHECVFLTIALLAWKFVSRIFQGGISQNCGLVIDGMSMCHTFIDSPLFIFFQHCCHWAVGYWLFKNFLHISVFQIRYQKRETQTQQQIRRHCDLWGWRVKSMVPFFSVGKR